MTAAWVTIAALAVATMAIKAAGPVLLGGRSLPPRMAAVIALLAPALLAALVITQSFGRADGDLVVDARAAGVAAAIGALAARRSLVVVVVAAAAATGIVRAL